MEALQTRLHVMHPLLYPEDDKNVMGFKPFQNSDLGADGTLGVGVHMHFMMTLFWWGFGSFRKGRERCRLWENRLAAAQVFRDFVGGFLNKCSCPVCFHIPWAGELRPCSLHHGILDLRPMGRWRELPALELLTYRWKQMAQGSGLHFVA